MSLNVLIVDDSAVMRSIIKRTLKMCGLPLGEMFEAANGQEGLDQLNSNWIDIALVDINMPVMNGEEMIAKLRENPEFKELPVIVVSTEGSETVIERLEKQGIRFIHKPFSPEIVREIMREITGVSDEDEEEPDELDDNAF
jgi:two-component system, chemotaxis family, chemotaxis protein CheY